MAAKLELFPTKRHSLDELQAKCRVESLGILPDNTIILQDTPERLEEIDDALDQIVGPVRWRYTAPDGTVEEGGSATWLARLARIFA